MGSPEGHYLVGDRLTGVDDEAIENIGAQMWRGAAYRNGCLTHDTPCDPVVDSAAPAWQLSSQTRSGRLAVTVNDHHGQDPKARDIALVRWRRARPG